jgi:hypothetical protein
MAIFLPAHGAAPARLHSNAESVALLRRVPLIGEPSQRPTITREVGGGAYNHVERLENCADRGTPRRARTTRGPPRQAGWGPCQQHTRTRWARSPAVAIMCGRPLLAAGSGGEPRACDLTADWGWRGWRRGRAVDGQRQGVNVSVPPELRAAGAKPRPRRSAMADPR